MKNRVWYKWPEGYVGGFIPWYLILWRLILWPFAFTGFLILYTALLIGWGKQDAESLRKELF